MESEPNYLALFFFFVGPFIYFSIKEFLLVSEGYKFCFHKGMSIGLVPGIGHLAVVSDIIGMTNFHKGEERKKDSCD
jgi:hypothetical protein